MKTQNIFLSTCAILALTACSVPKTDVKDPLQNITFPTMPEIPAGDGQPGETIIQGALISKDSTPTPYLTLSIQAGRSSQGHQIALQEKFKAKLSPTVQDPKNEMALVKTMGTLVLVDCPASLRDEMAKDRSFQVSEFKISEIGVAIISAQTVVLCGQLPSFKGQVIQMIDADELILFGVTMKHDSGIGRIGLRANHLTLWGLNEIKLTARSASNVKLAATLDIRIKESVSADDEGRLAITIRGEDLMAMKK